MACFDDGVDELIVSARDTTWAMLPSLCQKLGSLFWQPSKSSVEKEREEQVRQPSAVGPAILN
jgi:hypothetical protein